MATPVFLIVFKIDFKVQSLAYDLIGMLVKQSAGHKT